MIPQLTIVKNEFYHLEELQNIKQYNVQLSDLPTHFFSVAGIDPGTKNIGLAYVHKITSLACLWEINMNRENTTLLRLQCLWKLFDKLLPTSNILIIEGASYADRYRQIELQDIRCGATVWAISDDNKTEVQIIPPNTIRKVVFGSAKIKNPWKEQGIPDNAAAALGCALYPIMKGQ